MTNPLLALTKDWLDLAAPAAQIALICLAAWLLQQLVRRLIQRLSTKTSVPPELSIGAQRVAGFLIHSTALLLVLDRLGVSSSVLWAAFTGFATVGAVAFFAAWSVLSNIFCAILIVTTRPFRLHDHIELLENGEKAGLRGQVVDINLIYTTLREPEHAQGHSILQVPNNLFFQRTIRRWHPPLPESRTLIRSDKA